MSSDESAWAVAMNLAHLVLYTERLPSRVLQSLLTGGEGIGGARLEELTATETSAVELAVAPIGT